MSTTRTEGTGAKGSWKPHKVASKKKPGAGLIREAIFGINDGLVATVGLVSGESLSNQSHGSVIIAGLSAVGAAMVSMAVGSYLASTSQNDFIRKQILDQQRDIEQHPAREKTEVKDLLEEIGVPEPHIDPVQENIVRSRPRWLKFMVREQLGIHTNRLETPLYNAVTMGISVLVGSAPPVLPYLLPLSGIEARNLSWGLSLVAAMALGAIKGRLTEVSLWKSALSFAFLASMSASVGAAIGYLLGSSG